MVNDFLGKKEIWEAELVSIRKALESTKQRTLIIEVADKRYFIKRMRPIRFPISAFFVNQFFEIFKVGFLKVSLKYGGNYSFDNEIKYLTLFSQNQIPVPKLIHNDVDFLVLEVLDGKSVDNQMSGNSDKIPLWSNVLNGIFILHQKGFCLSQGFSRNMVVANDKIFFIDFEENPLDYIDLDQAQARDWIFFLLSTIWRFDSFEYLLPIWKKTISEENKAVFSYWNQVSYRFTWLRFLPTNRKIWGRDLIQLQALGSFFYQWNSYPDK